MSNVAQLRSLAKDLNIKGYSTAKKADLIALLEGHSQKTMPVAEAPVAEAPVAEAPVKEELKAVKAPKAPRVVKAVAEAKETSVSAEAKKARNPSSWSEFLKSYKREHSCSLKEAMSKKAEYAEYKAKKN